MSHRLLEMEAEEDMGHDPYRNSFSCPGRGRM